MKGYGLICFLLFLLPEIFVAGADLNAGASHLLNGVWQIEVQTADIGAVRTSMTLTVSGDSFEGHSRRNADKDLIGFSKATMGRVFTTYFRNGALLHFEKGRLKMVAENEYKVAAVLASATGRYLFRGTVKDHQLAGHLTTGRSEEIKGVVRGEKKITSLPLDNYPKLTEKALALAKANIFDPKQVASKDWLNFEKAITVLAAKAQDDLDMVFGFYYYAQKLPFSHFAMYRNAPELAGSDSLHAPNFLKLEKPKSNTLLLTISSFAGNGRQIDSIFNLIRAQNPANLIIDLRGNGGGNISAMQVAANLADKEYAGGTFVTQKWFGKHALPPTTADLEKFDKLTEANLKLLWDGIHTLPGLALKVIPEPAVYRGQVYILTDKTTASTCEPLVYGLKYYKRAVIVGEKTAGSMLNGESFKIKDQWQVTIPTADYYTPDGHRLDQTGVEPHYRLAGKEALTYVLQNLID